MTDLQRQLLLMSAAQFPTSPHVLCRLEWYGQRPTAVDIIRLRAYCDLLERAFSDASETGANAEATP